MTVFLPSCSHFSFPASWQPLFVVWQCYRVDLVIERNSLPSIEERGVVSEQGGGERSGAAAAAALSTAAGQRCWCERAGGERRAETEIPEPRSLGPSRDQSQGTNDVFFLSSFYFTFFFVTNRSCSVMEY